MCWFEAIPYALRPTPGLCCCGIYTWLFRSVTVDSCLFSFPLVRSRSVVPGVLEAEERLAVVVGSEHQLFWLVSCLFTEQNRFLTKNIRRTTWMRRDRGQRLCKEA